MYDLPSIVAQNRRAAKLGIIKPGQGVGTEGVKPTPVKVIRTSDSAVLGIYPSANEACIKYRQQQKQGEVRIEDVE